MSRRGWRELERQVALLERDGGGDGCPRCRGTIYTLRDAVTKEFVSASFFSEKTFKKTSAQKGIVGRVKASMKLISEDELEERETETECPKCGRTIGPDEAVEINIGGVPPSSSKRWLGSQTSR